MLYSMYRWISRTVLEKSIALVIAVKSVHLWRATAMLWNVYDPMCRPSVRLSVCLSRIELKLLLITNRKLHKLFQMRRKSSTLDDFEDQHSNRNCIGSVARFPQRQLGFIVNT